MLKNKRNKRGAELSLNVIIIAAIALIVLVILVLIFTGRIAIFRVGLEDCRAKGGTCESAGTECSQKGIDWTEAIGSYCFDSDKKRTDQKCCITTSTSPR